MTDDFFGTPEPRIRRAKRLFFSLWLAVIYWAHRIATRLLFICVGFDGPCFRIGKRGHIGTDYVNVESNYKVQCPRCAEAEREHWAEMWRDYWSSVLY